MDLKKSILSSLLAIALLAAVVTLHGASDEPEAVRYMPSVASLTGTDIFGDDDSSSSSTSSSLDDDDDSSGSSDLLSGLDSDDDSSSSSSGGSLSDGDTVKVMYKLRLADSGKEVYRQWGDDSFSFELGGGHVIPGFDSAVSGMSVGETKTVTIPADQAYGSKGFSAMGIPADSDLEYTLKVVSKDD